MFDAVETLAGAPAQSLPFVGTRIREARSAVDAKTIAALINKLNDDKYRERDSASKELRKLGLEAVPQLRIAAAKFPSAEVRQRADNLLALSKSLDLTADQKRLQAVLCVLEIIGSSDARKLLQDTAGADERPWLAGEAVEALKRMPKN
jgi:hypothetical protein